MKITVEIEDYSLDGKLEPIIITEAENGDKVVTIKHGKTEFDADASELIEALSKFV